MRYYPVLQFLVAVLLCSGAVRAQTGGAVPENGGWRVWTDVLGRTVEARFLAANDRIGRMELRSGAIYLIELDKLAEEERERIAAMLEDETLPRIWSQQEIAERLFLELNSGFTYRFPTSLRSWVDGLPRVVDQRRTFETAPKDNLNDERERLKKLQVAAEEEWEDFFRVLLEPLGLAVGYGPSQGKYPYMHAIQYLGWFHSPGTQRRMIYFLRKQPGFVLEVSLALENAIERSMLQLESPEGLLFSRRLRDSHEAFLRLFSENALAYEDLRDFSWLVEEMKRFEQGHRPGS